MVFNSIEEEVIFNKLLNGDGEKREMHGENAFSSDNTLADQDQAKGKINEYFTEITQRIEIMKDNKIHYPEYIMPKPSIFHPVKVARYFAKKGIRKATNWALGTVFNQQTEFNSSVLPAIGRLTELNAESINRLSDNDRTISQSLEHIAALEGKIQVLEQWFIQSTQKMESVNDGIRVLEEQGFIQQTEKIKAQDEKENLTKRSLSQSGEDTILSYILNARGIPIKDCSYLDLGANHAKQYSNTYYFYDKGARGVLVEANPLLIPELKLYRNEDIILNCCIGAEKEKSVDFYILSGDGLSTPDKKRVEEVIALNPTLHIERVVPVKTMTVNQIMDMYFENAPLFMNIDLEGDDMAILSSIDWEKHRPLMIVIETIPYRPRLVVGEKDEEIIRYMQDREYVEYAFTGINSIFLDKRQIKDVFS